MGVLSRKVSSLLFAFAMMAASSAAASDTQEDTSVSSVVAVPLDGGEDAPFEGALVKVDEYERLLRADTEANRMKILMQVCEEGRARDRETAARHLDKALVRKSNGIWDDPRFRVGASVLGTILSFLVLDYAMDRELDTFK